MDRTRRGERDQLTIKARLRIPRTAYRLDIRGQLRLPFSARQQSRLRTKLVSGEEVELMLPHGETLRGGDLVTASDGRVIEVVAEEEKVLHVEADSPRALARIAYHLGSRQVPVEVGDGFLRLAQDREFEEMMIKLGAKVRQAEAPFEPERGQGGNARDHHHGHDHVHDEHCGHDHHHHHGAARKA